MSKSQMFDSVILNQDIQLHSGGTAPQETDGAIVEIFKDGEGEMIEASRDDPEAIRDTLDVETLYPHQINSINANQQSDKQKVKQQLLALLELP
jgi:molybdopterin-guanine dinucleotide biosynthesis protein